MTPRHSTRGWITLAAAGCVAAVLTALAYTAAPRPALRVCSDPNNLPFSNDRGEGFENRIADLLAAEMGLELQYFWWAQRRGFARNTLNAGACDVVVGVPTEYELASTTRPYYRSSYVFVYRQAGGLRPGSLDDPILRSARIGVHLIGDDGANVPPAHALARRGIVSNVTGFSIYGNYTEPNPPARLVEAVARGEIDVAIAWGPLAGYFARRQPVPLEITPLQPEGDGPSLPFAFDIAMGVRRRDHELRERLDAILTRRATDIHAILDSFGVPRDDR
jgi:mxaJ protein